MKIEKVAIIGSGVMGSAIAAHFANAAIPVLLFDIVPKDAEDKSILAKSAIERLLKTKPSPFVHKKFVRLVEPCNLEDDLERLANVDWIVEAVLEDLTIKQNLYKKLNDYRKTDSVISSNTSTIPLKVLIGGMGDEFAKDFMITHFFNPPRYMRLLELAGGTYTNQEKLKSIEEFADIYLGKGVVHCKDTAGFLANRIGVFWLMVALQEAIRLDISVEEGDAIMSRPLGIPKTGVFGLFDLIGIDLMPLIAKAMMVSLPESDRFHIIYNEPEIVSKMIKDGYIGRKGKGGFYRLGEGRIKESINLKTGEYNKAVKSLLAKEKFKDLFARGDKYGEYTRNVIVQTAQYASSLIPEISDDIYSIDRAMKLGYNWKYGIFEMVDMIGVENFASECAKQGLEVPQIIEEVLK